MLHVTTSQLVVCVNLVPFTHGHCFMRNRDPHRENVENILAICLPIVAMQHIRESPSAGHGMRISAWNDAQSVEMGARVKTWDIT